jgi:hypothetical protein
MGMSPCPREKNCNTPNDWKHGERPNGSGLMVWRFPLESDERQCDKRSDRRICQSGRTNSIKSVSEARTKNRHADPAREGFSGNVGARHSMVHQVRSQASFPAICFGPFDHEIFWPDEVGAAKNEEIWRIISYRTRPKNRSISEAHRFFAGAFVFFGYDYSHPRVLRHGKILGKGHRWKVKNIYLVYLDEFGHVGPYVSRTHPHHNTSPVFGFGGLVFQRTRYEASQPGFIS